MKKATGLLAKIAFGGLATLLMTGTVLADSYPSYYDTSSNDAAAAGIATLFTGGFAILYICLALVGCLFLVFNIWMAVDAAKRSEAEMPNRTLWMVLLIVGIFFGFGWIVAIIYYFTEKRKLDLAHKPVQVIPATPEARK